MLDIKELAMTMVISSLYATLVIFLWFLSFGPIQLRVADSLIMLSALMGWPIIFGVTLGCFVGNVIGNIYYFGAINPFDIVLGPLANLLSSILIFYLRKRPYIAGIIGSFIISLIVGSYLWLFVPPPEFISFLHPWIATTFSLTIANLITIEILGNILLKGFKRDSVLKMFSSIGIKIYKN